MVCVVKIACGKGIDNFRKIIVNHGTNISLVLTYIVGFNHSCGHLRGRVDGELQLGFFPIVHRESLHEKRGEARSSASTKGVEEKEALKSGALVCELSDSIQDQVNNFLSNCVMASRVIVGSILLASDQLLRMEELAVGASAYLILS